jgi:mannose-6-phosphate isomerase
MLYPLVFEPIFKDRVWGGRKLADLFGKALPEGRTIGESWEISDRPEGVSRIANGPLAGRDLRWLMEQHGAEVLGRPVTPGERFPWLVKLLDARDDLSLQVHPPASQAQLLGGEPKTEMWFIAEADPGAKLYTGLKRGVTRADFERKVREGTVAECFQVHHVTKGDAMFLPSGRVHAVGGGNVLFEIQQNSDTTYRVFDWNRVGLDGKPRELHVEQSLASIDFFDCEPELLPTGIKQQVSGLSLRPLTQNHIFNCSHMLMAAGTQANIGMSGGLNVIGVLRGEMTLTGGGVTVCVRAGSFALLPASLPSTALCSDGPAEFLRVTTAQSR